MRLSAAAIAVKVYHALQFRDGIPFAKFERRGDWLLVADDEPRVKPTAPMVLAAPSKPVAQLFTAEEAVAVAQIDAAISRGLGDDVAAVAQRLGLDKAAALFEKITGISCGCSERRKWLNDFWPHKSGLPSSSG